MRKICIGLFCVMFSGLAVAKTPPNIVVILSDDQGYADVSYSPFSPKEVSTPNIDKLAASGVVCTDGYASGYVCSPTRAGVMTGRYQQRFGIYTAGQGGTGMPLDETWMPMHLKPAGYTSGAFGKWHLGITMDYHPNNRGFDYFYGFMGRGAHDYWEHSPDADMKFGGPIFRNQEILQNEEGYMTSLITKEAVDFIKREKDNPFFAYVAYNAVHAPPQAPEEDIKRYDTGSETRDILMAMLHHLDLGVGEIVQALKDAGVYENTIIFYLSDNGGASAVEANNAPLRGMKQHITEGGIRVPFIVSWPGKLKADSWCNVPVWSTDILPTSLALAGIDPLPGTKPLDGKDIMPALKGNVDQIHDALYWCSGSEGKWAVRQGDWKYLFDKGETGLYNLDDDISEENNLKDAHPEKFQALEKLYNDWFEQMGEPAKGTKHYEKKASNKKAKKSAKDAAEPKPAAKPKKDGDLGYGFKKDGTPRKLPPVTGTPEEKKAKREKMRAEQNAKQQESAE
ncbi:Arylsulfatase [Pontiella desulfatans]|uniref:Arylsulfatase n=1 Tax=Pontiella desulfatans TaxID=2750659 RepID=A0A6C2U8J3_PONDE|nr:sulfatase-like hydrolase/transferase [Pontiella desulfatans]SPS73998.1 sulfatase S1_19 [Kiritimatiellales bacterium]VGO15734.1 Arylsulfatase [Pontiella desulfatans]